jgi:MYXO-CTERM domain-containing protein
MQSSQILKTAGYWILAICLAVSPLIKPASAQTSDHLNRTSNLNSSREGTNDRNFNWGWLGLLGLAGLAGLAKDNRADTINRQDPRISR